MINLPPNLVARLAELETEILPKAEANKARCQAKVDALMLEVDQVNRTHGWGPELKASHRRLAIWRTKSCNADYSVWTVKEHIRGIKGGWFTW